MLARYRNLLPIDEGGTTSVQANVSDIADWISRKPVLQNADPYDVARIADSIVDKLADVGYNEASRVSFISEAIRKQKENLKPTKAIALDIKQQILVILKEAGINTEGKEVIFI